MFRDAAARIKKIKPSAVVMSVEALPWWQRAAGSGRVDLQHDDPRQCGPPRPHLRRLRYHRVQLLLLAASRPDFIVGGAVSPRPQLHHDGLAASIPKDSYDEIRRVGDRYGKPMMITENGIATEDDDKRIWYMQNHLAAIGQAIRDGYDVRGYFAWSLADNYEWHYGYKAFFGLAKMDPKDV